ncbi:hypothetical protein [Paenibacillus puerhi]|nr:hypothetical protein [Paenibacillus puerhi]
MKLAKPDHLPDPRPIRLPSGTINSKGQHEPWKPFTRDNVGSGVLDARIT